MTIAARLAVFIGIDLGTSAVKILAVTANGQKIAAATQSYGLITPQPEIVEQDADELYGVTMRALTPVLSDIRARGHDVAAIGFSSAMHGLLAVDTAGEPLTNLITWMDRRSAYIADQWRADGTGIALYRRTGAPMHSMLPLAKLRWLRDHRAPIFDCAQRFVGLKELFIFRWTGEWLVDWGLAAATGLYSLDSPDWDASALELAGVNRSRLAEPVPPSTVVRTLRPAIARELELRPHTAVVLGSSDGALSNLGLGATLRGDLAVTLGTSGAVRITVPAPALDHLGRTFCYRADDTRYIVGGPTSSAGAALDWIFALLLADIPHDRRFERATELAEQVAAGAHGVVILPFLAGERAPYWRSGLRASIIGLDLAHNRDMLIRAALEGVVFGLFAVYDVVRATLGDAQRLLLCGGLTMAPLVRRLVADIFDLPALQPREQEAAALGAALFAAAAISSIDDPDVIVRQVGYYPTLEPQPDIARCYADLYGRYAQIVAAQLELYPTLPTVGPT